MECFSELEEKIGCLENLKEFEFIRFWPHGSSFLLKLKDGYHVNMDILARSLLDKGYTTRVLEGNTGFKIDGGVMIISDKETDCLYDEKENDIRIRLKDKRLHAENSPYVRDKSIEVRALLGPLLSYLKILYGTEGLISTCLERPAQSHH